MKLNKKTLQWLVAFQFILCSSYIGEAQEIPTKGYIILDSLADKFKVSHYTMSAKKLYNVDKVVEIYNVPFRKNEILLTLSVLPSFEQKDDWEKIDPDTLNNIISTAQLYKYATAIYDWSNTDNANVFKFAVIKRIGNDYYVSRVCLTQRFNVRYFSHPLNVSLKNLINVGALSTTIQDFQKSVPEYAVVLNPENDHSLLMERKLIEGHYLSKKVTIGKDTAYQFWTFTDWHVHDWWNEHRGIDRFIYIPNKGIVGGSYDFWFAFKPWRASYYVKGIPVSREKLWDNIINEKVMLTDDLNINLKRIN